MIITTSFTFNVEDDQENFPVVLLSFTVDVNTYLIKMSKQNMLKMESHQREISNCLQKSFQGTGHHKKFQN